MIPKKLAFITGATSGLGKAFAKQLAEQGYNLILQGRRKHILETFANELIKQYGIEIKVIIAELSNKTQMLIIEKYLQDLDHLDILINNAGYWIPGNFWEQPPEEIQTMIMVHDIAPARFIRAVLPSMIKKNKGSIINVCSISAYFARPSVENYCATKAYLLALTESLHTTFASTNIAFQALMPRLMLTELHTRRGIDSTTFKQKYMMPDDVAKYSLRDLEKKKVLCIPNLFDRITIKILQIIPRKYYYLVMRHFGEHSKDTIKNI